MPHGATYEGVHSTTSSDLDDRAQGRPRSADDTIVASGSCPENNVLRPQIQPAFGPSERIIRSAWWATTRVRPSVAEAIS